MALDIVDEFFVLEQKNCISSNSRWKIKETGYNSLFALRHSNIELEGIFIDKVIVPKTDLPNHVNSKSDDSIKSDSVDNPLKTKKLNPTENTSPISEQNPDTLILENNTDKKHEGNNLSKKKKNTTIWIFISVIVILIIVSIFVKIGCFPNYTLIQSNQNDSEELVDENLNN
jgi:hypothetical protein